ncbi:sialate O-acetylesterase [Tichowtungia aerotolerans]|uniref:Cellulase family glycosylhydrolase n=1 Tax=Tichowtungia aerotolerans TaxID=2697043 RepID=A0A6P1MCL9_9BACT|nr:sialate O-acetylesterase [Tichowtungia aerotolerans]QHI68835.1 cellulase family glycosylhydrolase [Tichowtungia aerotolerans]
MKAGLMVLLLFAAGLVSAAYVDFIGQDGVPTVGAIDAVTNWPGGVLPSGSVTGRIAQANNVWVGIMQDLSVRLEAGQIDAISSGLHQRGNTVLEIDTTDWATVTNLDVSGKTLTLWSQNGGTNVLSILNGRVDAGSLNMATPGKGTIHMGNGVLGVSYWETCKGAVNMLVGGAGAIEVATVNSNEGFLADCLFNFESGSAGSITLGEIEGGTSAAGTWEGLIASGNVSIDGVPTTDAASFSITNSGTSTMIQLAGVVEVADLWMPSVFSSGMVLQSGQAVPVWGEAEPGATVTVEFAGQVKTAVADSSNHWKITLDPMAVSSAPRNLIVSTTLNSQLQTLNFSNVFVGEVWLLSGQSNMGIPLLESTGGAEAAAAADYPWLRVFTQWPNQGAADEPARDVTGGRWFTCTPDNAGTLSGVGFFFARALQASLPTNTPIALINTQMGGTYAECWIDFQTLENTPSAAPFLEKAADEVVPGGTDPDGFWGTDYYRRPSALYNGKVAPLQPFSIRGVIWYQGEANSQGWLAPGYAETLTALVNSWRQQWERAELPFLIVQLPRYGVGEWNDWPAVRAAQTQVANNLSGVELAVTIDLGEENEIHPADKEPVGERLALLARANVYGETIDCSGPFFQTLEINGGDVLVEWTSSEGLFFENGVAQGFEVCGSDGVFVSADAEILSDGWIRVFSLGVPEPLGARYGWFNWGDVSLFNSQGLPAAPFRYQLPVRLKPDNTGNLYDAANWVGDVLPVETDGQVGLVDGSEMPSGGTFWVPSIVYDISLQQEGGVCVAVGDLNLRGGATNEAVSVPGKTVWTIDDSVNEPGSYTNLFVPGNLIVWSHMGGGIELNLLRGRIEAGDAFRMVANGKGILNIRDGVFRSQYFKAAGGIVNLLSGGTADVNFGQMETADRNVVFNFESGFKGAVTISKTESGAVFTTSDWQQLADAGKLTIDGVPAGLERFGVSNGGTTLQHFGALPGLAVVDGVLYKEGIPYKGVGVNYCDLFQAMINFPEHTGQTEFRTIEGLRFLGELGIPFARFWACGFWPSDWDLYFSDKEEWFSRLDLIVATAEEVGVGLIPSVFWRMSTYPELIGETRDQLANPNSDTWQFMSNYIHEVVGRYKDSPAIWGWEYGNEFNNMCDLPNWTTGLGTVIPQLGVVGPATEVNESNKFTYAIAEAAFGLFTQEVRKFDTHRFITTGNSRPRPSAWHNRMEGSWTADSYSQAKEAHSWMAPTSSIDMASFHVYPYSMEDSNGDIDYAGASGVSDILQIYREFCDDQNQAMFVGEYSSFYDGQGALPENEQVEETALLEAIVESGADLAAYWVFDRGINRAEEGTIYPDTGAYMGVLDLILEYDAKMRGEEPRSRSGIPVEWFRQAGVTPTNWQTWAEIEAQDLNGNGMTIRQEYIAGFQPLENGAAFAITDFQWLENSVPSLSWRGGTNGLMTPYVIQSTTNLLDSESWTTVGTKAREQGSNTWTGPATDDPSRCYRVLAVPEND